MEGQYPVLIALTVYHPLLLVKFPHKGRLAGVRIIFGGFAQRPGFVILPNAGNFSGRGIILGGLPQNAVGIIHINSQNLICLRVIVRPLRPVIRTILYLAIISYAAVSVITDRRALATVCAVFVYQIPIHFSGGIIVALPYCSAVFVILIHGIVIIYLLPQDVIQPLVVQNIHRAVAVDVRRPAACLVRQTTAVLIGGQQIVQALHIGHVHVPRAVDVANSLRPSGQRRGRTQRSQRQSQNGYPNFSHSNLPNVQFCVKRRAIAPVSPVYSRSCVISTANQRCAAKMRKKFAPSPPTCYNGEKNRRCFPWKN